MIAWAATVAVAAVGANDAGWVQFSRTSTVFAVETRVTIGTLAYDGERRQLQYWLRRRQAGAAMWTDSRRCPQVREVLVALRYVGAEPQTGHIALFFDTATYTLDTPGPSGSGATRMTSGDNAPLAKWVNMALAKLEPCWSATPPVRTAG